MAPKDDVEDIGDSICRDEAAHSPKNCMEVSVREDSSIQEEDGDLGEG